MSLATQQARQADHGVWAEALNGVEPRQIYQENISPDREATRWLWTPGNIVEPKRARELRHLRVGGMELDTVCLRRFKGILPRLRFTPLEMTPEWIPSERIPDGVTAVAPPHIAFPQTMDEQTFNLINVSKGRTPGVKVFPGDALAAIMATANNDPRGRRGIVEITALKGHIMDESEMWQEAQLFFFDGAPYFPHETSGEPILPPDWPMTINAIRARIDGRCAPGSDSAFRSMADEMLAACDDFYWWGAKVIHEGVALTKAPMKDGFALTLPPLVRLLSEQLEIPLEEDNLRLLGQAFNRAPATVVPPVQTNDTQLLIQTLMEQRAEDRATIQDLTGKVNALLGATVAPAETAPASAKPKNGNAR